MFHIKFVFTAQLFPNPSEYINKRGQSLGEGSIARLPRNTDSNYIRHIIIRTKGAASRLLPNAQVTQIIGGILAKYQQTFSIIIYAYHEQMVAEENDAFEAFLYVTCNAGSHGLVELRTDCGVVKQGSSSHLRNSKNRCVPHSRHYSIFPSN